MNKWIFKCTTLKTPFHIALSRMKLRSHCTFFQGRISVMAEIKADLFLEISKTGMCLLTSSFFNVYCFGSQLAKVRKNVGFSTFFKVS